MKLTTENLEQLLALYCATRADPDGAVGIEASIRILALLQAMVEQSKDEDQRAIRAADEAAASKTMMLTQRLEAMENDPREKHVDDFIDHAFRQHCFARYVLFHYRLPAVLQMDFKPYFKHLRLTCTYQGETWLVTQASRLGVLGLRKDLAAIPLEGYDTRVNVNDCSNWSDGEVSINVRAYQQAVGRLHRPNISPPPEPKRKGNRAWRRAQAKKGTAS